jgi:hypothetical protein
MKHEPVSGCGSKPILFCSFMALTWKTIARAAYSIAVVVFLMRMLWDSIP